MKLTRRRVLYASLGSVGAFAAAGGALAWSKRLMPRVPKGWVGYPEPPSFALYPSEVGLLGGEHKEALWELMTALGTLWEMDPGAKATFLRIVDLKTTIPPSYRKEYENAATRFAELKKTKSAQAAARTMLVPPRGADEAAQHARVYVMQEFVVRLLVSGGFRQFSLGKWRGYAGGPRGFRMSERPRTRTR